VLVGIDPAQQLHGMREDAIENSESIANTRFTSGQVDNQ
jgi:hypothetical protein